MKIGSLKLPPLPNRQNNKLNIEPTRIVPSRRDRSVERINPHPISQSPKPGNRSMQARRPQSTRSNATERSRYSSKDSKDQEKEDQIRYKVRLRSGQITIPKVTARSWILYEMRQSKRIWGRRTSKKRQIASLTKILNLLTILQTLDSLCLSPQKMTVQATSTACTMTGTTAELKPFAEYSLYDLLFGMMLPSGNDAAYLIAEIGGYLLSLKMRDAKFKYQGVNLKNVMESNTNEYVNSFLKEMNYITKKLFMHSTYLANPHGLSNTNSYSNTDDLAKLCTYAMRNQTFRKIVQTQRHLFSYYQYSPHQQSGNSTYDESSLQAKIIAEKPLKCQGFWNNTNKLLQNGWSGIKTGITPNAGPCLASSVLKNLQGRQYEFLVVLLSSQSMQARWQEAQQLVDWAIYNRLHL